MAQIHQVHKARASRTPRACTRCQQPILPGQPYLWFALRGLDHVSVRRYFHADCQIRRSDMTLSPNLARLWDALDDAQSRIEAARDPGELGEALQQAAGGIRAVVLMYRQSAQNIEQSFRHPTRRSLEIRERADDLEAFADSLVSAVTPWIAKDLDKARKGAKQILAKCPL